MDDQTERFEPPKPVELRLTSGAWVPAQLRYWHRGPSGRWVGGVTFLSAGVGPAVTTCVTAEHLRPARA